ncbi:AhpD-like protein [Diplogelasinospora grovesii]|uniref:AhpD-like protein n=1 Tax=Diplogelasinospora grovesii TaxID=303347 RepID=A0AAN6S5J8_9PEZI|nr:AhpD-like protein [Diplogelasinospora grovesii]
MRLPYVPNPPRPTSSQEDSEVVARIQARRAPRPLQALDLTLLHSVPVADGWNSFLGAVRTRTIVADDLRELAISRVAVVNRAWYEWMHHAPLAQNAGVSEAGLAVVKDPNPLVLAEAGGEQKRGDLTEKQWVVLCYADEMTRNVQVKDETFGKLRGMFSEREVVEITATVAAYNCVSRFLVALDVGEKNGVGPDAAH